jgi:hypothetical protein
VRLRDLFTGGLTWAELGIYIRGLPPTCRLRAALAEDGRQAWTATEHLLADIWDVLAAANWQRGNAGQKQPGPRPKGYPRPGQAGRDSAGRRKALAAARERAAAHRAATAAAAGQPA